MNPDRRQFIAPAYLFACLLLGGSSQGIWGNALLQLLGLAIIALALRDRAKWSPIWPKAMTWMVVALLTLFLAQLIPLPPAIWIHLPGRDLIVEGDELLGFAGMWRAISMSPTATLATLVTLIPPIAMIVAVVTYAPAWRQGVAGAVGICAMLGLILGAAQVGSGTGEGWYLYRQSNVGVPTGFFANGNHMAALLLCVMPFAGALVEQQRMEDQVIERRWVILAISTALAVLAVAGVLINRSLFGIAMIAPVGVASLLIAFRDRIGRPVRLAIAGAALLFAAVAIALVVQRANPERASDAATSFATRADMVRGSWHLMSDTFPAGTGAGTFEQVYRTTENPSDVTFVYVNHAHNDYLEWAVEGGLPGVLLILYFLWWWSRQLLTTVRDRRSDGFALAGIVVGIVLLIHSVVDFPLRTAALAATFAAATGLMLTSRRLPRERPDLRPGRHLRID